MVPMVGDPDDHRPNTSWSLIVDPGDSNGRVDSLAIIREAIAAGDRIPLHTHDVDEAITIIDGEAEARLGDDRRRVGPGTTIFIPAGTPHGAANIGDYRGPDSRRLPRHDHRDRDARAQPGARHGGRRSPSEPV